ncbi:uncharacterized protein JCM15063_002779 [Sporobolomyces koalae]|uniref:uncharacterized protein n=1 Tax=Sporobolomyces koalae TaxID=500713 RepID=UPI0031802982
MAGKVESIKDSIRSKGKLSGWTLEKPESSFTPPTHWSNKDTEPVTREEATWTTWTFLGYWMSDLINAGSWSQVSSFVGLGLTWWEGVICTFFGGLLISMLISANGIIGARLHVPFAISARAAYGYWFSRFAIVSRAVIAMFWLSVNSYQGGTGIRLCLIAIWPSFATFDNHLSKSSGTTSSAMLCFFLFWLFQFPLCFIHPRKLRPLFILKGITLPIVAIAMTGWCIAKAGDQRSAVLREAPRLSGVNHWFAVMTAINSCMSTWSTLSLNISDMSRYSRKPSSAALQVAIIPSLWALCAILGSISANMATVIPAYDGKQTFQPFDLIENGGWLDSHGGRAAAFFCSAAWAIGNMTTNITANSISAANDLATLFPRYLNIRRGQILVLVVGCWAFAPWKVLASASAFLSFMASYAIVLIPLASILAADYYFVKRSKYDVPALYDFTSIYRYKGGFNLAAVAALVVSIPPNMPGMINSLNPSVDIGNAKYIYCMACIIGVILSMSTHVLFSKLFPDHDSLIAEAVNAHDVLDGLVPAYAHLAKKDVGTTSLSSEKKLDEAESDILCV